MQTITDSELFARLDIAAFNDMQEATQATLANKDQVLLLAPTGSGKTLAFLLPILRGLRPNTAEVQCLIIVPTRELAAQIEHVWRKMQTGFKVNICYGGHSFPTEVQNFSEPPTLLIGTPGRLADHIQRESFVLDKVRWLVLDEFDKSLELGYQDEMSLILGSLPNLQKKVFVSATDTLQMPDFAGADALTVLDFMQGKNASGNLFFFKVTTNKEDKLKDLFRLLCSIGGQQTIIFCLFREDTETISKELKEMGIEVGFFHGGMEQEDRESTLMQFRNGAITFLAATDLAARGLDIPSIQHIVHYQIPKYEEEFVHRNGRTARMEAEGNVYLLWEQDSRWAAYLPTEMTEMEIEDRLPLPPASPWTTIYVSGGKKDKLNKGDIVGFFLQKGKLDKSDIGLIEVKEHQSFVAVKKNKVEMLLAGIKNEKMKTQKYKIQVHNK